MLFLSFTHMKLCRKLQWHASRFQQKKQIRDTPSGPSLWNISTRLMGTAFPRIFCESIPSFQLYICKCPERQFIAQEYFNMFFFSQFLVFRYLGMGRGGK